MHRSLATLGLAILLAAAGPHAAARAQDATPGGLSAAEEERLRVLSDPDALKKDVADKDKQRPPFEVYRSQVAPNDVLPWIKARHWHGMIVELRANLDDYEGSLQTTPIAIPDAPLDVAFGREARLVREQRTRLGMSFFLPEASAMKEVPLELVRAGALRPDQVYQASVKPLAPHQMLTLVLTRDSNAGYANWSRIAATVPASVDRGDAMAVDALRYYRLVLPLDPREPLLPTNPLTWTAVSHVIWDAMEPDVLSVSQQDALVDWIHWGGQLILMGGAGPKFSPLRESFLDPYLPADPAGDGRALEAEDLAALSTAYLPPPGVVSPEEAARIAGPSIYLRRMAEAYPGPTRRPTYGSPAPIHPATDRPVRSAGMRPREGSTVVPIRPDGAIPLAVERRVGRGRITMLALDPMDPALVEWRGMDTLIRRVVFRRPEESAVGLAMSSGPSGTSVWSMQGPDLSWYRIASRDVGAAPPRGEPPGYERGARVAGPNGVTWASGVDFAGTLDPESLPVLAGTSEWRDDSQIPRLSRDALEASSGIKVPSSSFVLKVILAYVLAVAPLNWLVCRVLLRRRELAWAAVPLLALGFAGGVERFAARDLGFDSAGDELDVLELQGEFPRGHLTRFGSIYGTGHGRYAIRFPDDPTTVALPYSTGRSISGEDRSTLSWRSFPVAALEDFAVQPRSIAMYRAEQMLTLPGAIAIGPEGGGEVIRNGSGLELRDAVLIRPFVAGMAREVYLGSLAPGATVGLPGDEDRPPPDEVVGFEGPDPSRVLAAFREALAVKPEEAGEFRLVAWSPGAPAGPQVDPPLDRRRGVTVVVAHLRYGPPPSPGDPHYDLTAER